MKAISRSFVADGVIPVFIHRLPRQVPYVIHPCLRNDELGKFVGIDQPQSRFFFRAFRAFRGQRFFYHVHA